MRLIEAFDQPLTDEQVAQREVLLKRVLMDVSRLTPYKFKVTQVIPRISKRYESAPDEHTGTDKTVQVAYHRDPEVYIYLKGFTMNEQTQFFRQLNFQNRNKAELKRRSTGWAAIKVHP